MSRRMAITPGKGVSGNADCRQGDARDHRRICQRRVICPRRCRTPWGGGIAVSNTTAWATTTSRFLVEELLPFVAKEFNLKLSADGNDRCIAGGSSGGITAFNAAWERPDAFSRVYANSGSFVAFRGGHEFPTLVRKFEAKPIRAYLTTGTDDMENCAGDWFLIDQEMDKALRFSGYDYFFRIINGGHVAGYYDYFREAMSYIWKDWPKAGPSRAERAPCATSSFPMKSGNWLPRASTMPGGRRAMPAARCFSSMCRTTRSAASSSTAPGQRVLVRCRSGRQSLLRPAKASSTRFRADGQNHALRPVGQGQPGRRRHSRPICSRHARRRPLRHRRRRASPAIQAGCGSSRTARKRWSTRA